MSGMFYSLEETAEKLNKTKEELKELVKQGDLREFRDGPNLLFKAEEVEALVSKEAPAEAEELPAEPIDFDIEAPLEEIPEFEDIETEEEQEPVFEEESQTLEPAEADFLSEAPDQDQEDFELASVEDAPSDEESLLEETKIEEFSPPEKDSEVQAEADVDDILLSSGTDITDEFGDLTNADTALTGQGTSILGQSDKEYDVTEDTMAKTSIFDNDGTEAPLEEIEEDVNLDSFGSGSGLLDLSLQADDTSLGGILDEIYTDEGEASPEDAAAAEFEAPEEMAEEEAMIPEDQLMPTSEPQQDVAAIAQMSVEPIEDKQSSILGMMLFLPLLAIIYTTIVITASLRGVAPSILVMLQGFIWYIVIGAAVAAAAVSGLSFVMTGEKKPSAPKEKKVKAKKAKKAKKEKKPKKEKKAKAPKEKKPKKPKKGKK